MGVTGSSQTTRACSSRPGPRTERRPNARTLYPALPDGHFPSQFQGFRAHRVRLAHRPPPAPRRARARRRLHRRRRRRVRSRPTPTTSRCSSTRATRSSTSRSRARARCRSSSRRSSATRSAATSMHLDCQQVDLKQEIQADIAIELDGVEDAPGVKEGGILEHVTREITIEALPTDIPDEGITVDVSAMVIGDTIQLFDGRGARGRPVRRRRPRGDHDRDAQPAAGRRGGARGRGGDRGGRRGRGRGRGVRRRGDRRRRGRLGLRGLAAGAPARPPSRRRRRGRPGIRLRRLPDRRPRQPGQPLRGNPAQRRLRGRRRAQRPLGAAEGEAAASAA